MSTLGKKVIGDGYGNRVAAHLRQEAATAKGLGEQTIQLKTHVTALKALAAFVAALPQTNQVLRGLQTAENGRGIPVDRFEPGPKARVFLAQVGLGVTAPDAAEAFEEFAAACVEDLADKLKEVGASARRDAERTEAAERRVAQLSRDLSNAEEEVTNWREKALELEAENRQLTAQVDHAVAMAENPEAGDDAVKGSAISRVAGKVVGGSRRQRHPDVSNLYHRKDARGTTIYELGFREDGKQRWKTVGPNLQEALDARKELVEAGLIRDDAEGSG